ncbi:hypothetical protein FSP39_015047 [Pinctada imbricata]|uniref:Uncharacterized protein n=1 Tax=Pinctada imbricata TaxID=66713 RepID=A0AA88Y096_PINIB|nr:hypothetical protein FSP39_015047 [Pinctada imbricata]
MTGNAGTHGVNNIPTLMAPPPDPLRTPKSSEDYIHSLEDKLRRIKGNNKEPSSRDIIQSLEKAKSDQMAQLMQGGQSSSEMGYKGSVVSKSHSGKEQNMEEVVALVFQDELGITHAQRTDSTEEGSGENRKES